jgi:hypothetical protein
MNSRLLYIASLVVIGLSNLNLLGNNLTNDLVGYWPLNSTSGDVAYDASGNGQNGILVNYPGNQGAWVSGQVGGALQFNSSASEYVSIPSFTEPTTTMTISAWVNETTPALWGTIVSANWNGLYGLSVFGNSSRSGLMSDYFSQPNPQGIAVNNATESLVGPLSLNTWYLMTMVITGNSVLIYRDGQLSGGVGYTGSLLPSSSPLLTIGGLSYYGPGDGYWNGEIQDVALWTRALSPAEIESIYQEGTNGDSLLYVPDGGASFTYLALSLIG